MNFFTNITKGGIKNFFIEDDFCDLHSNMRLYLNFWSITTMIYLITSLFLEYISMDQILFLSALIPVVEPGMRETRVSLSILEKIPERLEDPFKGTSFIDKDIKDIISKISAEAPDTVFYFKSFISQLESARSSSRAELASVHKVKNKRVVDEQNKYKQLYKLEEADLCPMIFVVLPTILISLVGMKVEDNWKDKQEFTMPELIVAILRGIKNTVIPSQARRELLHYLRKYTPEIREFLAMAVIYIEEFKRFDTHKIKLYGLASYFKPMCEDPWNRFKFSKEELKDGNFNDKLFCLVFYKVYIGLFHPGCLALIANIRAILAENKVALKGAIQTFFETGEILYPYVKQLSESTNTKIMPWEKTDKKASNSSDKKENNTKSNEKIKNKYRFYSPKAQNDSIKENVSDDAATIKENVINDAITKNTVTDNTATKSTTNDTATTKSTTMSTTDGIFLAANSNGAVVGLMPATIVAPVEENAIKRTIDSVSVADNVVETTKESIPSYTVVAPAEGSVPTGKDTLIASTSNMSYTNKESVPSSIIVASAKDIIAASEVSGTVPVKPNVEKDMSFYENGSRIINGMVNPYQYKHNRKIERQYKFVLDRICYQTAVLYNKDGLALYLVDKNVDGWYYISAKSYTGIGRGSEPDIYMRRYPFKQ
jgi:hypothetical protein